MVNLAGIGLVLLLVALALAAGLTRSTVRHRHAYRVLRLLVTALRGSLGSPPPAV